MQKHRCYFTILLLTVFLFSDIVANAQADYNKFIKCSNIVWAADATDTISFGTFNLSNYLRQQLIADKINAAPPAENFNLKKTAKVTAEDVRNRVAPNRIADMVDNSGNIVSQTKEATDPLKSELYFDSSVHSIVEIPEILFLKNGKCYSYIPWVAPKYNVYTSWGEKLGTANAFFTSFNHSREVRRSWYRRSTSLGNFSRRINIKQPSLNMLKQLYQQTFVEALWPFLDKDIYHLFDVGNNKAISFDEADYRLIDSQAVTIPVYDAEGNLSQNTLPYPPLPLSEISYVDIRQQWYYHQKKNILFNKITNIVFYAKKWRNGVQDENDSAILNIVVD